MQKLSQNESKTWVKEESIKLLEENIRVNISDLEFAKIFLDKTPKAWVTKEKKYNKLDFNKLKYFVIQNLPSRKWKDNP